MTAHVDSQIYDGCRAAGMDDSLTKPFRRQELRDMVKSGSPVMKRTPFRAPDRGSLSYNHQY